jgi:light-regulated signal transduction histidine kinase (bacteriophytochrome)
MALSNPAGKAEDRLAVASGVTLTNCELEPIHIPGAIQPHGAMLAARLDNLLVSHVSENLAEIVGIGSEFALGRPLQETLGDAAYSELLNRTKQTRSGHADCLATIGGVFFHLHAHRSGGLLCVDIERTPGLRQDLPVVMVQSVLEAFKQATTQLELCEMAVRGLKALTGYDRVMAYRFGKEGHGEVFAEAIDESLQPYLGLRYPASDVPPQARQQYLLQRVGAVADSTYEPVPMLAHAMLHDGASLDMTYCVLRSISPMHREYMRNMGTAASLTIALTNHEQLWGMLVCHHATPRIAWPELRAAAGMVGQIVSLLLTSLGETEIYSERLERGHTLRALTDALSAPVPLMDAFAAAETELLKLVEADGAIVRISNSVLRLGRIPPVHAAERALSNLARSANGEVLAVEDLALRYPELASCTMEGSGALLLPLSKEGDDVILWFRPELPQQVLWGGDPSKQRNLDPATDHISPRKSFAAWKEIVRGRSAPWREADLDLARELRTAIAAEMARRTKEQLTRALTESQRAIRDLLDNADQGFMTIGSDLSVGEQSSAACETILGEPPAGKPIFQLLRRGDTAMRDTLESVFHESSDFVRELKLELLPTTFDLNGKSIKTSYKFLSDRRRLMLVLTDVTQTVELAEAVERERYYLEMIVLAFTEGETFAALVSDYRRFLADGLPRLIDRIESPGALGTLYRHLHTYKGLLAQFSFYSSPHCLHEIETTLSARPAWTSQAAVDAIGSVALEDVLRRDLARLADVLGPDFATTGHRVVLSQPQLRQMEQVARDVLTGGEELAARPELRALLQKLISLSKLDVKKALAEHGRGAVALADRLEKKLLPLRIEGAEVSLPPEVFSAFFRSLVHVFRNAVSHGIEPPDERVLTGKAGDGAIRCDVHDRGNWLEIEIEDDGRGVDRSILEGKLIASGETPAQVESLSLDELLFREGLTSNGSIDEVSGRGIGLAAVMTELERVGGSVAVETKVGAGTCFRFRLPIGLETRLWNPTPTERTTP